MKLSPIAHLVVLREMQKGYIPLTLKYYWGYIPLCSVLLLFQISLIVKILTLSQDYLFETQTSSSSNLLKSSSIFILESETQKQLHFKINSHPYPPYDKIIDPYTFTIAHG